MNDKKKRVKKLSYREKMTNTSNKRAVKNVKCSQITMVSVQN